MPADPAKDPDVSLRAAVHPSDWINPVPAGRYDLVVIDTAPPTVVSDAIPLITLVDGVVVVTRLDHTLRDHARRLRQQLDHLDAPLLGIVMNSAEEAQPYGYRYRYEPELSRSSIARRANGARPGTEVKRASMLERD